MEQAYFFTNEYFSNLINEIKTHTDKKILNANKSEIPEIINIRNLLILNVEQIQIPDINKNIVKTGFFIPNNGSLITIINFANQIGKLIILNDRANASILHNLNQIFKKNSPPHFKTFKEVLMTYVLEQLIKLKSFYNDPIIDLSKIDENVLEKIYINGKKSKFNDNDFNDVSKLINSQKLSQINLMYQNENFQSIHSEMFANFKNLKKLVLKCTHLNLIKTKNFSSLPNLEYLSITESKVNKIENGAFHGLTRLKWLILSSNELIDIQCENFLGLDHLEYLILNQNKIGSIDDNTFEGLINLKALEMVENQLNFLAENSFNGLFSLKVLNLNNNKSNLKIDSRALNSLSSLEILDLASNTIQHLDPLIFEKLKNLRYLNLSNNLFRSLDFLNDLEKLEAINVIRMKQISNELNKINLSNLKFIKIEIEHVPIFNENFSQLKALDLHNVTDFEENCFKNLINLGFLKIVTKKDSIIDKINENLLKPLKKIRFFYIEVKKFGDKSLEKFQQSVNIVTELFKLKSNYFASETEIDDEKNILYIKVTDCESEWMYLEHILDISAEAKKALLTSEISVSHYENIAFI